MTTIDRLIMASTFRQLVERVRQTAESTLPNHSHMLAGVAERAPKPLGRARRGWSQLDTMLNSIDDELARLATKTSQIGGQTELTFEARQSQLDQLVAEVSESVASTSDQILRKIDEILADLRDSSMPPEPTGPDTEARLANLRSDARMVLDPASSFEEIEERLSSMLERSIRENEPAMSWLLATSHWSEDYYASRGLGDYVDSWRARRQAILDERVAGDEALVRDIYRRLANPQSGLALLRTLTATLPGVVNDIHTEAQNHS